jgi:hypothetical protein
MDALWHHITEILCAFLLAMLKMSVTVIGNAFSWKGVTAPNSLGLRMPDSILDLVNKMLLAQPGEQI